MSKLPLDSMFRYIDSGRLFRQPFQILYYVFGVLMALFSLYSLSYWYDLSEYAGGVMYVYMFLMGLVVIAIAAFTVIFWFRRAGDLINDMPNNARFQAIPAVSNLLITFGEWLGICGAIVTFSGGILGALLLSWDAYDSGDAFLGFLAMAVIGVIICYLILVFFRLIGEQILAIGVIANNTRKIMHNTEHK